MPKGAVCKTAGVSRGFTLWLIGAFLAVVKRMRKENALISYGFFEKPIGVAAVKLLAAFRHRHVITVPWQ
jgi:hypothetical protein